MENENKEIKTVAPTLLDKIIDRSIFKGEYDVIIPKSKTCSHCKGSGFIAQGIRCNNCENGEVFTGNVTKKANIQCAPVFFEENKARILYVTVTYTDGNMRKNISVKPENIILDGAEK